MRIFLGRANLVIRHGKVSATFLVKHLLDSSTHSLYYFPITSIITTYTANHTFSLQSVDMLLNSAGRNADGFRKSFSRDLRILFYESKNF